MTLFDLPVSESKADAPRAAPAGPLVRVAMLVAYDGSGFRGFAAQRGARTVGGELTDALSRMAGGPVEIVCAGRTDAGVHATAQVVHADLPERLLRRRRRGAAGDDDAPLCRLARGLSSQLGPEIAVRAAAVAPEGFDARHSAIARRYRYHVLNTPAPDPLLARTSWHVPGLLDVAAMRLACDMILGEHDFTAFCRRAAGAAADEPIRRRVLSATWERLRGEDEHGPAGLLRFEIEANAFCHQMVRALVGAHVAAGAGRMTAAGVGALLRSASRQGAPTVAPPGGLCLTGVTYPPELHLPF